MLRPNLPSGRSSTPARNLLLAEYDNLSACVRCGLCLPACPTYAVTHLEEESPRGRIAMARAVAEGHLALTADLVQHQHSCLLCEACTNVCPAGVHMEPIGLGLRAVIAAETRSPLSWRGRWARAGALRLFRDMRLFRLFAASLRLYQRTGVQRLARGLGVLRWLGLERAEGLLPTIDRQILVPSGQVWRPPVGEPRQRVLLFAGCIMSTAYAEVDRATARVLAAHGCEVVLVPGQGCCGALNAHAADRAGARALARQTIAAFEHDATSVLAVNAAGCGAMLKGYGHLLADDPAFAARAEVFARRVRDVSEILALLEPVVPLRAMPRRIAYQDACHLAQAQRITREPRRLLARIPGVEVVEIPDASLCCGSAGIYNILQPEMADTLQARKVAALLSVEPDVIVSANPGCILQIADGLRRGGRAVPVRHLMEVLDEALPESARTQPSSA